MSSSAEAHAGWIPAAWSDEAMAPSGVRAISTTRAGGVSLGRYASMNLGIATADLPERVAENRRRLQAAALGGGGRLQWLTQVHGSRCVRADAQTVAASPEADAVWTDDPSLGLVIQTADCVPVLVARTDGQRIGAAHAGWRGLVSGVVEALVAAMRSPDPSSDSSALTAWIGPAIGPAAYEVGADVHDAVLSASGAEAGQFLTPGARVGVWNLHLAGYAAWQLRRAGVLAVHLSGLCTSANRAFYSYRRDGETGRMATVIWREASAASG